MRHCDLQGHRYCTFGRFALWVLGLGGLIHSGCEGQDPYNQSPFLGRKVTMLLTSNVPETEFRYRLQKLDAAAEEGWMLIGSGTQVEATLREAGRYEIAAKAEGYVQKSVKLTEPIKVYSFQFLAADRRELVVPGTDPVTIQLPSPGEKVPGKIPPPVDVGVSKKWAVVIGISEYRQRGKWGLANLRYARRDAEAMAEYLRAPTGGRFDSVNLLVDQGATAQAIRAALREDLRGVQENDLVLIYWAGHGMADPHEPARLYLLGHDTDPAHMPSTGYAMEQFQQDIQNLHTQRVLIFADACHSAGLSDPAQTTRGTTTNKIAEGLRGIKVEGVPRPSPPAGQCHLIFTSCEAGEQSLESAELEGGHGIFTYFLLDALCGAADRRDNGGNADGRVTLGEMLEYTVDKVKRFSENRQHPDTAGRFDRNLALSR